MEISYKHIKLDNETFKKLLELDDKCSRKMNHNSHGYGPISTAISCLGFFGYYRIDDPHYTFSGTEKAVNIGQEYLAINDILAAAGYDISTYFNIDTGQYYSISFRLNNVDFKSIDIPLKLNLSIRTMQHMIKEDEKLNNKSGKVENHIWCFVKELSEYGKFSIKCTNENAKLRNLYFKIYCFMVEDGIPITFFSNDDTCIIKFNCESL